MRDCTSRSLIPQDGKCCSLHAVVHQTPDSAALAVQGVGVDRGVGHIPEARNLLDRPAVVAFSCRWEVNECRRAVVGGSIPIGRGVVDPEIATPEGPRLQRPGLLQRAQIDASIGYSAPYFECGGSGSSGPNASCQRARVGASRADRSAQ